MGGRRCATAAGRRGATRPRPGGTSRGWPDAPPRLLVPRKTGQYGQGITPLPAAFSAVNPRAVPCCLRKQGNETRLRRRLLAWGQTIGSHCARERRADARNAHWLQDGTTFAAHTVEHVRCLPIQETRWR